MVPPPVTGGWFIFFSAALGVMIEPPTALARASIWVAVSMRSRSSRSNSVP
jgi:hypothetical protein